MPIILPKLQRTFAIVESDRAPTQTFQQWWQSVAKAIEAAVLSLEETIQQVIDILVRLGLVEITADGALALAESAINPDGTIKDDKVLTSSMQDGAASDPWRVVSSSVIAFAAATKTEILSVTVTKQEDDSYLELSCQVPFESADAIDIDIGFEAQQAGVPIQTIPDYRIELDANNATKLPWAFVDEFDALDAGSYDIKIFGTRFSADTCSTLGTYKMRVREFKR